MPFLYTWIFVLSISLTIAVQLDDPCNNDEGCDGGRIMHCQDKKCQCNAPWYTPCKSKCDINPHFAYQGEECRVAENCIGNAICQDNKCECTQGFTAKNGACLKNVNDACTNNTDCWSQYCLNSRCSCAPGQELVDGSTNCRKKLVNVYKTWADANADNAFCIDKDSCLDIIAECFTDTAHPTQPFCKCPTGYQINENKECKAIIGQLLSPLDNIQSSYGECGSCEDDNAACINAGKQTTCWCRAGYIKSGTKCVKQNIKPLIIFPNSNDTELHDFTNDCKNQINETNHIKKNKLCVCSPGYEFIAKDQPCAKIRPKWMGDIYEYGVCTRINSKYEAIGENGQCPEPLKCEAREDKHVCSCGNGKFLDPDNPTQCVYRIGYKTNSSSDTCPKYAERNSASGICECLSGYKATADNRQCEIKLSSTVFEPSSCNSSRSNDKICQDQFGKKVQLCNAGECRCPGYESYPNNENTRCYAPVNQQLTSPMEDCPPYSTLKSDHCECESGYRPSSDSRQCVRLAIQLIENSGSSTTTNSTLTTADCQKLFTGPVESYDNNRCQCKTDAFVNDDKKGCWYNLDVTLTDPEQSLSCPPNSATDNGQICKCNVGFTKENNKCVQITNRVYIDKDPTAKNITGLNDQGCATWLGHGAIKSTNGDYCICRSDAYPVQSNTHCHFFINIQNDLSKVLSDCPANTIISPEAQPSACVCKPGYISYDNQTCVATNSITLNGSLDMAASNTSNCVNIQNSDCIDIYGKQAFCKDDKCYCNRRLSFVNTNGKCESFSNYVYPGEHELSLYACNTEDDCGGKEKVVCDYFNTNSRYKVCTCRNGALLDPKSQTCVENRCTDCKDALGFECHDYECICKNGYSKVGAACIKDTRELALYQSCNPTTFREMAANDSLICDQTCERAECNVGYRPEKSDCVRYQLMNDKCVHQELICLQIDPNSICDRDKNQCFCKPSYYPSANTCARAVGSSCSNNEECGADVICKGQRCTCRDGQREENQNDSLGRPIKVCVNGIDKIRFNPVLLLLFVFARVFFI